MSKGVVLEKPVPNGADDGPGAAPIVSEEWFGAVSGHSAVMNFVTVRDDAVGQHRRGPSEGLRGLEESTHRPAGPDPGRGPRGSPPGR